MEILTCEEIGDGRVGPTYEREGRRAVVIAERVWKAITDDKRVAGLRVMVEGNRVNFANGIPLVGDAYQTDDELLLFLRCTSVTPEQDGDDPFIWRVRVSYSSDFQDELVGQSASGNNGSPGSVGGGAQLNPDPLKKPPEVSYGLRVRKKLLEKDADDKATVNSAGERFAQPLEEDEYNLVITIRRNVRTFDRVKAWSYVGCVNEKRWENYAERAARITNWTGEPAEEMRVYYYVETLEIEVQYPNWDIDALNEGTYGWSDDGQHVKELADNLSGLPLNGKILLDSLGHALPRTEIALAIAANAAPQAVAPASMFNIKAVANRPLIIRSTQIVNGAAVVTEEEVRVRSVTATTFTAIFTQNHAAGAIVTGKPTYKTFKRRAVDFKDLKITL